MPITLQSMHLFLGLARRGLGVVHSSNPLYVPAVLLVLLFYSQCTSIFLIGLALEAPMPLHAVAQAASVAALLRVTYFPGGYNCEVCAAPPMAASPLARIAIDWMYAAAEASAGQGALAADLPFPPAQPPVMPALRCQAVMAYLQLTVGLLLTILVTAVREARSFSAWAGASSSRSCMLEGGGGWQAALYRFILTWSDLARSSPLSACLAAWLVTGMCWHAVMLAHVPLGHGD